ncbi:CRISPR-associated endonuclease Cas2 [Candidatus Gottesmanbacteria bacterium]|nr:CRISPR-associated endonuclease Cas2 [Candidatus Gottesmanbacteria bacterium]
MNKNTVNPVDDQFSTQAERVFGVALDYALWVTYYFANLGMPQQRSGASWRARVEADQFLQSVNYQSLKVALRRARRMGYVKKMTHHHALPEITAAGKKRLLALIPRYDEKRVWDQKLHLVTYDISEKHKKDRRLLFTFLKNLGCGRLQDSVWMTPYNPVDTVREFVGEHGLSGMIIVSDIGRDGSIGDEDIQSLVVRIYRLDKINEEYERWLGSIRKKKALDPADLVAYLDILSIDPQIPFSLLPSWWKGDEAYKKVQPLLQKCAF